MSDLTVSNRDMNEQETYYLARIEALKQRIAELEAEVHVERKAEEGWRTITISAKEENKIFYDSFGISGFCTAEDLKLALSGMCLETAYVYGPNGEQFTRFAVRQRTLTDGSPVLELHFLREQTAVEREGYSLPHG